METNNNLSSQSAANLNEAAKWANIVAIIGFVMIALSLIGFMMFMKYLPGQMTFSYLISMIIYIIPYYFMFKFAGEIKKSNTDGGIANLKSYFKFIGILTIVGISLGVIGGLLIMSMF